jgi:putative acetyltransferase
MQQNSSERVIRKPSREEYQTIVSLWEASVRATHHFLYESDIEYFRPLILNQFLDAVDLWGLYANGELLGFLGVHDQKVEMLFVHPREMGKGFGKLLLLHAIHDLGANKVDVNEQNPDAVAFYRYMGFEVVNRSPLDGLGKPYPILHMELR